MGNESERRDATPAIGLIGDRHLDARTSPLAPINHSASGLEPVIFAALQRSLRCLSPNCDAQSRELVGSELAGNKIAPDAQVVDLRGVMEFERANHMAPRCAGTQRSPRVSASAALIFMPPS